MSKCQMVMSGLGPTDELRKRRLERSFEESVGGDFEALLQKRSHLRDYLLSMKTQGSRMTLENADVSVMSRATAGETDDSLTLASYCHRVGKFLCISCCSQTSCLRKSTDIKKRLHKPPL